MEPGGRARQHSAPGRGQGLVVDRGGPEAIQSAFQGLKGGPTFSLAEPGSHFEAWPAVQGDPRRDVESPSEPAL